MGNYLEICVIVATFDPQIPEKHDLFLTNDHPQHEFCLNPKTLRLNRLPVCLVSFCLCKLNVVDIDALKL